MAKRKHKPARRAYTPPPPRGHLYVSHCHFEQLTDIDLSAYEWGHITPEALAQIQAQFGQMKWLSLQAEQLGEALAQCEQDRAQLQAELAKRDETIAEMENELARLRKRVNKRKPREEFEG